MVRAYFARRIFCSGELLRGVVVCPVLWSPIGDSSMEDYDGHVARARIPIRLPNPKTRPDEIL